jgi:hypothetical protein
MKAIAAFLILSVALAGPAGADTRVRMRAHKDAYYHMGETHPAVDRTSEIWFCDATLVYVTDNERIVFDTRDSSLVYLNLGDSTYVETDLPLDWRGLASSETLEFLERYKRRGEVMEALETRMIDGFSCRAYDIASWLDVEDGRYDEREERVWMSRELPIDWSLFEKTHRDFLALLNYHDDLIAKLLEIEGFSVVVYTKTYIQGFSVDSYQRVVDVSDAEPPPGLTRIPDGFRKKPGLTMDDING